FTCPIANESVIITRTADGEVRAMMNVCRHRGSRVCLGEEGHANRLVCPYHAWVYNLDGSLANARHMPEPFDKAAFGLRPAHVRVVEDLIFICLAENPPAFDHVAGTIQPYLAPQGLTHARIAHRSTHRIRANWKLVAENFW